VSVVVISLDLTAKIYPIIYSIDKLPYDCLKLVAMPKPVTGVLVIAANSLLHVSQGSPGVGVAVNGYTKKTTEFAGMLYPSKAVQLGLSLDGAKALAFGGDRCLIFLQNGHWAVVQMKMDGSKIVGMDITEIAHDHMATVPSCVANVTSEYFFLGSRVGDSLLIKWNPDALTFKVCDTLLNTGPIIDMTLGDVESNQHQGDEEQAVAGIPDMELVSCSGHGKNGSLCVFQRHIHPQTSFSFQQSDSQAIWSIKCRKQVNSTVAQQESTNSRWESQENDAAFDEAFDKLLFISKSKSTLVLSAGDELQELVKTGFYTRGPTIAVSTLFDATLIVQVYATGVMILTPEGKRIRTIPIHRGSKIIDASIRDPYIILTLDNNKIVTLQGDPTTKELATMMLPSHINKMPIAIANIFADTSDLFSSVSDKVAANKRKSEAKKRANMMRNQQQKKRKATITDERANKKPNTAEFDEVDMDLYGDTATEEPVVSAPVLTTIDIDAMDDDDDMLYGTTNETIPDIPLQDQEPVDEGNVSLLGGELNEITRVSFWCLIYTTDGTLYIYSLPDYKECFVCPQFDIVPDLIIDHRQHHQQKKNQTQSTLIQEILMTNIGRERKDPHLVARTETNDIIIYKAFSFIPSDQQDDRLALRFSRVHHEYVSRRTNIPTNKKKKVIIDKFAIPGLDLDDEDDQDIARQKLLIPFHDVAGYTGVFVAGSQPAWLMNSCKSFVRVHPMKTTHAILGFTQFHNVNCQHGFITVDATTSIRLSRLRTDGVIYDLDWVLQKIPLGKTAHKIQYHPLMRVYAVLVSTAQPARVHEEDTEETTGEEEALREVGEFLPEVDRFSMIMVSPVTWEIVDTVEFEEFEQCFSLQCAALESKQTSTGRKHFMVVGTGCLRGEDTTMRGSVSVSCTLTNNDSCFLCY
jgi:cleavage and polyadenylation specificity factor subunit 1